jgi:hypothetical protein
MTTQQRLARLKNRQTLYECVAKHRTTGQTVLIMYSAKSKSRFFAGISDNESKRGVQLVKLTGTERLEYAADPEVKRLWSQFIGTMGDWLIGFTGRTQRECILESEEPYIGDVVS